jgi:hypothetical protein
MRTMLIALLLAAGVTVVAVAVSGSAQDKEPPVVCGLRNQSYTGLCEERTPYVKGKKLEALCKPILDCLNDTRCIKTYCGATTIRRGWVLESATRDR